MMDDRKDPSEVVEQLFVSTESALLNNDFDAFRGCFCLPYTYETVEKKVVVSTEDAFRMLFDEVCARYRIYGVAQLDRRCLSADYADVDAISATYETRLMGRIGQINPTMRGVATYRRVEAAWKIASDIYGIDLALNRA